MSTSVKLPANSSSTSPLTIALIGNPNTGKSTLFNALTGGNARIGNFPGVTVEKKLGSLVHHGRQINLVDLPGTYSLAPRSADEMVSVDVLLGRQQEVGKLDAVVCIADANNLERNLYLFSQIRDLGLPVLLVLNMWDLAKESGTAIDLKALEQRLGVKIVTTSAQRREGIDAVRQAILETASQGAVPPVKLFSPAFYEEIEKLGHWLKEHGTGEVPEYLRERLLLDVHGEGEHRLALKVGNSLSEFLCSSRQRLLDQGCRIPLVETKVRYNWIREQLNGAVTRSSVASVKNSSDRIDRWLTHWFTGVCFFIVLMFLVFQSIFSWAAPLMGLVESGQEFVSDLIKGMVPPGMLQSLLVDGIVAGVGSVLIFLPQIMLLFLFIAVLEDCGYMARAAFLMDKLMSKIGLSGKSFLPLMSSFACAIPGVMATRVIENRRDRMVTMLIAPLMSCSARLPVYVLMISAFIPSIGLLNGWIDLQGIVLFLMYSIGALVAIPVALILKKTFFKGETPPFVMELPNYKWPSFRVVFDRVLDRAKAFVLQAGSLIFAVTVLVWAAGYFPEDHAEHHRVQKEIVLEEEAIPEGEKTTPRLEELLENERHISAELIHASYLGRMGRAVEPIFKPLGWDWRLSVGAIASFPAREVIIATLGTIFSLGGDVSEEDQGLIATLQNATWPDGSPLFTIPVALSVMVFFALCAQCGATLMVIRRETNSWIWPIFTFVYMTTLAYIAALIVYQVGTRILG
ncbi:ferrous iron transport protein B [Planctomicrobium sp. SH668]|uniref:ferrous iron transport protein B n=1 Tax=Planctomicrobium sp. SH668 TaxID=3448126 RepID=UPI003F5BD394